MLITFGIQQGLALLGFEELLIVQWHILGQKHSSFLPSNEPLVEARASRKKESKLEIKK